MPFKIVRNDITKMHCDAIVNTANDQPTVGTGCDSAIYNAAGFDDLLQYRVEKIGVMSEGEVFITPAFNLDAKLIIHAVSPLFIDGKHNEEALLRSCYQKSLQLAVENNVESIAFPLISTGGFGYPKEEGMRIAVDEINAFLLQHEMLIYLVVFCDETTSLGKKLFPDLETYIDENYVSEKNEEEYGTFYNTVGSAIQPFALPLPRINNKEVEPDFEALHLDMLDERLEHSKDSFSQYLLYLIQDKGMTNAEVYKRAIVDKKVFSKIKNNPDYHPQKITAMCLCIGAKLNMDETIDLLARAGYALSPCDRTDIIFSYFIENRIYDMIELDIQLEEHGEKCLIS